MNFTHVLINGTRSRIFTVSGVGYCHTSPDKHTDHEICTPDTIYTVEYVEMICLIPPGSFVCLFACL